MLAAMETELPETIWNTTAYIELQRSGAWKRQDDALLGHNGKPLKYRIASPHTRYDRGYAASRTDARSAASST